MKIKYEFVTGETVEIEVTDDIAEVAIELDKDIRNSNRRENDKHNSIEKLAERGTQLSDDRVDIHKDIEQKEMRRALQKALDNLLPQQRKLIKKVFFEGQTMADIARKECVSKSAVQDRLNRICIKLKNIMIGNQ